MVKSVIEKTKVSDANVIIDRLKLTHVSYSLFHISRNFISKNGDQR